jgi:hypothetical protein
MSSPLEKLRAIARNANVPGYEINERNEKTPPPDRLLSFNSFLSYSETFAKPADSGGPELATVASQSQPLVGVAEDDLEERAALIEEGAGVPRTWSEGFAALCTMLPPAGISGERWQRIIDAAGNFIDKWAAAAIRCGWSELDIFGVDPDRPDVRFDCMGLALLLDRCEVIGLDENGADLVTSTGARQRFRRRPLPAGTVSLWQLAWPNGAA